jgi:RNA polymerase sigma-70 factor (ECF subfamily)
VREARPRYRVERQLGLDIAGAFFTASRSGDMTALGAMLAAHVSSHSDGGGKRNAAPQPILGRNHVLKMQRALGILYARHQSALVRTCLINGLPGFVTREADGMLQTTALDIEDGKIVAIYVMRNPDKLRHLH